VEGHAYGARRSVLLEDVLEQRIISARMPVPYPRMKSGSRVPDNRLMARKILHPSEPTDWREWEGRRLFDRSPAEFGMVTKMVQPA